MTAVVDSSAQLSSPVSPRVRRGAIFALAVGGFGIGTTEFVAMGLLPNIAHGLGVTEPEAGHVISAYALGVVVGAPVIAALTARASRRTLLIALMVAFTIGNAATMFAPGYALLIVSRFISGLPHGAYFGVAALVAAHLAGPGERAKAVGQTMLGLSVANVVGVPVATWLGNTVGWRSAFAVVAVIGLITIGALLKFLPGLTDMKITNPLTELGALRRAQVWFTLLIGVVGFGGMFAFYTYISTTLTSVSGLPKAAVPLALALYGIGMVAGNVLGGWMADRSVVRAITISLVLVATMLVIFVVVSGNIWAALVLVFAVGVSGTSLVPALQTRLMDVADDAQTLAAALNHSALNMANAGGAWLGGLVIAAGYGYRAPSLVGAVLAVAGLGVLALSLLYARRRPIAPSAD
ncbi:MFS transporter [Mycobacteroides salmoniphilum]|uniref:MFS transporter n=1 Tax=Mycobacteroides salmoniphilum TaxID=404941 RepID=UPI0010657AD1|nr:MFS transporter [Mycobacteroides salmoniphilum]TDZ81342.1 Inner membrane transport protein YdhP [Mycobacteroides salmoniphilum]TDZ88842.1 Inner membrane transport protein YdhP [Mycobacteroides salmoniphilum]